MMVISETWLKSSSDFNVVADMDTPLSIRLALLANEAVSLLFVNPKSSYTNKIPMRFDRLNTSNAG